MEKDFDLKIKEWQAIKASHKNVVFEMEQKNKQLQQDLDLLKSNLDLAKESVVSASRAMSYFQESQYSQSRKGTLVSKNTFKQHFEYNKSNYQGVPGDKHDETSYLNRPSISDINGQQWD